MKGRRNKRTQYIKIKLGKIKTPCMDNAASVTQERNIKLIKNNHNNYITPKRWRKKFQMKNFDVFKDSYTYKKKLKN